MRLTINKSVIVGILTWFVSFALSFVIQSMKIADQGKAFLYIYCVASVFGFVLFLSQVLREINKKIVLISIIVWVACVGITFLLAFGASKLIEVDFKVAFELITLGQVLASNSQTKK